MKEQNEDFFAYTYSAKEQEELKRIRDRYIPREEDKMEQLRRLDRRATNKGLIPSLTLGIVGALIMGTGMSCAMVWAGALFVPGIIIGILGMALAAAAYPTYKRITERERAKVAPEIMRLTDELMR